MAGVYASMCERMMPATALRSPEDEPGGSWMTYEQCQAILAELRRRQGTERPFVQVNCGKSVVRGRVNYSASGLAGRRNPNSPYGVLVLEQMGLARTPSSFVQIASIPDDGLEGIEAS
jgi:hypothetical protein